MCVCVWLCLLATTTIANLLLLFSLFFIGPSKHFDIGQVFYVDDVAVAVLVVVLVLLLALLLVISIN